MGETSSSTGVLSTIRKTLALHSSSQSHLVLNDLKSVSTSSISRLAYDSSEMPTRLPKEVDAEAFPIARQLSFFEGG